jgi:hypothetical protein
MMLIVKIMILTPVISNLMPPEREMGEVQHHYKLHPQQRDAHQTRRIGQTAVTF